MGCDIHIVLERRKIGKDEWIGVYLTDALPSRKIRVAQRDYGFFAECDGVRERTSTTVYERNLPEDVSRLAWQEYMTAPTDHHSPSHMSIGEFTAAWLRANPEPQDVRADFIAYDLLGVDAESPEGFEYRVVFWFDN